MLIGSYGYGQISPGPLSSAHSHLEGISSCTQCHDLGHKVPDNKCLECHQEILSLVSLNRGYHSSEEVKSRTCVECHNEHHGLKFDLTRFDEENFNHDLTGYPLVESHDRIECRDCHQPDNIFEDDLKEREHTYLGLFQECISCHDDYHQNDLGQNCASCHNIKTFKPAPKFDHNDTDFALTGAHREIDCLECHPISHKNGMEHQAFTGITFDDCVSCHDDPHQSLPGNCTDCHNENSFSSFLGQRGFNHNKTNFTLNGSHAEVNCFECHDQSLTARSIFQDKIDISSNDCIQCHEDTHDGKFGADCRNCHNENNWLELENLASFDHTATDYSLEGKHIEVDCKSCHTTKLTDPIDFSACKNCHDDYHNGEFVSIDQSPDCNQCHSLEKEFTYTLFGPDEHNESAFPLKGSHLATPCFECHLDEEQWTFRNVGLDCIDCHENIHGDEIVEAFLPENDCKSCHNSERWSNISFDHAATDWPLTGQHVQEDCRTCHMTFEENQLIDQSFANASSTCVQCHENPHGSQFEENGITDCNKCHKTDSWEPEDFNHNNTAFPLDGKHKTVACRACHKNEKIENGQRKVIYQIERFECVDCHS